MLDTPGMLGALAAAFDGMQEKHRAVVQALRGGWSPDREDVFIREMSEESGQLASLLRNGDRARFCWITLPEMMAVEETADAVSELGDRGLEVHDVIVNRITTPPARTLWVVRRSPEPRRIERQGASPEAARRRSHLARGARRGAAGRDVR